MVAEGIGGQASGAVDRRRRATLLVIYIILCTNASLYKVIVRRMGYNINEAVNIVLYPAMIIILNCL